MSNEAVDKRKKEVVVKTYNFPSVGGENLYHLSRFTTIAFYSQCLSLCP